MDYAFLVGRTRSPRSGLTPCRNGGHCQTAISAWSELMRRFSTRPGGQRVEHGTATRRRWSGWMSLGGGLLLWYLATSAAAQEGAPLNWRPSADAVAGEVTPAGQAQEPAKPDWHYGGFLDLGASIDFNFPDNHQFRSRGTTPRVN